MPRRELTDEGPTTRRATVAAVALGAAALLGATALAAPASGEDLRCRGNRPAPTGGGNRVAGLRSGQCRLL